MHKLTSYRLSPAAIADMEDIWRYTYECWSVDQADRYTDALEATFNTLLTMPEIARERDEFTPTVRIHPSAHHVIVYRIDDGHLDILRVLGDRQNWHAILAAEE